MKNRLRIPPIPPFSTFRNQPNRFFRFHQSLNQSICTIYRIVLLLLCVNCQAQKIPDDAKHVWASCGISVVTCQTLQHFKVKPPKAIAVGALTSLSLGITKELWDMKRKKQACYNWDDQFSNSWGLMLSFTFNIVINDLKKTNNDQGNKKRYYTN